MRLIDADKLDFSYCDNEFDCIFVVDKAPTIDAEPARHGRWENYEPYLDGYRCSCCKLVHRTCTTYCPNCGAKMDEEVEHDA